MATGLHRDLPFSENHVTHSLEYVNAAARTGATGLDANDVSRIARQLDTGTFWILKSHSPVTWSQVGGGIGDGLTHKAGNVLAAAFSGSPKQATVAFTTSFPDTNFVVMLTAETANNKTYSPSVMSKATTGFTIALGSGSTTNLVSVGWIAVAIGESG